MRILKSRITAAGLIVLQVFLISPLVFPLVEDLPSGLEERTCLSPALRMPYAEFQIFYKNVCLPQESADTLENNYEYDGFLKKIISQIGTAESLLEKIKADYGDYFGAAIAELEKKEKKFSEHNEQWVIEHQKEVMLMSYYMGWILGLDNRLLARIALAARFHDIGKCEVNPAVINDERLFSDHLIFSERDRETIRDQIVEHSARSYEIIKESGIKDEMILSIAFYHHANVDGTGYPDPVTRQEIPLGAKITRVTDSFSAMLGSRPYDRPIKKSFKNAVSEILDNEYSYYGPRVARTFLSMIKDEKLSVKRDLYYIPLIENNIFRKLFHQAGEVKFVYPFAKVACGISEKWNEMPYVTAVNSIGTHRHAEVNLILKTLSLRLRENGAWKKMRPQMRRLEFLAYSEKLNQSVEAIELLKELSRAAGDPFQGAVIYGTLRPCAACLELLGAIGIKEIYFGSEHPDPVFVKKSEAAAEILRYNGVRVVRAYFVNEGVLEPNKLFFAYCRQPEYEQVGDIINAWFAKQINHDDAQRMPISRMREKEKEFLRMSDALLGSLKPDADLSLVIRRIKDAECLSTRIIRGENYLLQDSTINTAI